MNGEFDATGVSRPQGRAVTAPFHHPPQVFFMQRSASDPRGVRNHQPPGGLQGTGCRLREDVVFLADHTKLGQKASFFFAQICDHTCVITDVRFDIFPHRVNYMGTSLIADTDHLTLSKLVPCSRRAQTPLEKAVSYGPGGHWPLRPASGPRDAPAAYRPSSHAR